MSVIEQAKIVAAAIGEKRLRLCRLQWKLEQALHNYRFAKVGSSGIEHRIIGTQAEAEAAVAVALAEVNAKLGE